MTDTFFNGRQWRKLVGEQEVKFLESLYQRTGGAPEPTQNLTEVSNSVTNLEQTTNSVMYEVQVLRRLYAAENDNTSRLLGIIKKLEHRISQLEDSQ
ncbi:MAG TPA: hypothetical protein V6D20_03880 [Candidatus Obscuribacterales bacterium]